MIPDKNNNDLTPDNFDSAFDELIEKGFLNIVGFDEDGNPQYSLSDKTLHLSGGS